MAKENSPLGYVVALFDVMGFEFRLKKFGLDEILSRYVHIVDFVKERTERNKIISEKLNLTGPFWLADGSTASFYDIKAMCSSDSVLLWANLAWKMVQDKSVETLKKNENHPAYGHFSKPVPLEPFLSMCAEIICRSIEFDLPLRGAIAMGDAAFDEENNIYLGNPIVDAARLENKQNCIGLSICSSFVEQSDHNRFFVPYSKHFKADYTEEKKEFAFNWPLYWMNSRTGDLKQKIHELAEKNNHHIYYSNTLEFIGHIETLIAQKKI